MTFTNRSILLQELFNYKHKQRKCLTVDEFDAYQKNKFAYSYRLKFVEKYESLFKSFIYLFVLSSRRSAIVYKRAVA